VPPTFGLAALWPTGGRRFTSTFGLLPWRPGYCPCPPATPADRCCPLSLALCAGAYCRALEARGLVRRLTGPFALVAAPACTNRWFSTPAPGGTRPDHSPCSDVGRSLGRSGVACQILGGTGLGRRRHGQTGGRGGREWRGRGRAAGAEGERNLNNARSTCVIPGSVGLAACGALRSCSADHARMLLRLRNRDPLRIVHARCALFKEMRRRPGRTLKPGEQPAQARPAAPGAGVQARPKALARASCMTLIGASRPVQSLKPIAPW